jgi:hypothetical protein
LTIHQILNFKRKKIRLLRIIKKTEGSW